MFIQIKIKGFFFKMNTNYKYKNKISVSTKLLNQLNVDDASRTVTLLAMSIAQFF